jgi:hypothetical protein
MTTAPSKRAPDTPEEAKNRQTSFSTHFGHGPVTGPSETTETIKKNVSDPETIH